MTYADFWAQSFYFSCECISVIHVVISDDHMRISRINPAKSTKSIPGIFGLCKNYDLFWLRTIIFFSYLVLEIVDDPDESIIKYFPQVWNHWDCLVRIQNLDVLLFCFVFLFMFYFLLFVVVLLLSVLLLTFFLEILSFVDALKYFIHKLFYFLHCYSIWMVRATQFYSMKNLQWTKKFRSSLRELC